MTGDLCAGKVRIISNISLSKTGALSAVSASVFILGNVTELKNVSIFKENGWGVVLSELYKVI